MILDSLTKVEQFGFWPERAFTTMFFYIHKDITSEKSILCLLPTMILELLKTRHGTLMDRNIRDERNELPKKVHDVIQGHDGGYKRGVVNEMVSGIIRGNWQRPNVVPRGTELRVRQDFLSGNKRFRKGLV